MQVARFDNDNIASAMSTQSSAQWKPDTAHQPSHRALGCVEWLYLRPSGPTVEPHTQQGEEGESREFWLHTSFRLNSLRLVTKTSTYCIKLHSTALALKLRGDEHKSCQGSEAGQATSFALTVTCMLSVRPCPSASCCTAAPPARRSGTSTVSSCVSHTGTKSVTRPRASRSPPSV